MTVGATTKNPRLEHSEDDLRAMLECLPSSVRSAVDRELGQALLLEVVLDLGRQPQARFADREVYLDSQDVSEADIEYVVERISPFGGDNRAGIERTLHRISALRNRAGKVVGLTCRVGRAIFGTAKVVEDLVMSGKSVLLVGRPGVGKTTMLREMARVLADNVHKRVVIVDTSNEIAGDGDIPHSAIGKARRLQVPTPAQQHAVMIEAVENHMPEAVVIDEMGTEQEAAAARTIAERGVQLIATAHGNTLENLLVNPTLCDLVGGVQTVTLGDDEARRRRTQKTILERKAPPTFDVMVEIQSWERVVVHVDVAKTVDRMLRGQPVTPEIRWLDEHGVVQRSALHRSPDETLSRELGEQAWSRPQAAVTERDALAAAEGLPAEERRPRTAIRIHLFGIGRENLERAAMSTGVPVGIAASVPEADLVLTTKTHFRRRPGVLAAAEQAGVPVFVLRRNTADQIRAFLRESVRSRTEAPEVPPDAPKEIEAATGEAEQGVEDILAGRMAQVELGPRGAYVRRIQHRIAEEARLRSFSVGREPGRRVTITKG